MTELEPELRELVERLRSAEGQTEINGEIRATSYEEYGKYETVIDTAEYIANELEGVIDE